MKIMTSLAERSTYEDSLGYSRWGHCRWNLSKSFGPFSPQLAICLECRTIARDVPSLAAFVADLSSSIERASIGCGAIARYMALHASIHVIHYGEGYA